MFHGRRPYEDLTTGSTCSTVPCFDKISKLYTRKALVLLEKEVMEFHENIYIQAIQKLAFHLVHVNILGTRAIYMIF